MRLVKVDNPRPGQVLQCRVCGRMRDAALMEADLDGEPFKAYQCHSAPGCDYSGSCDPLGPCSNGELRVLPNGDDPGHGNTICCENHHAQAMRDRRERNLELSPEVRYSLPAWESLKVYENE